MNTFWDIIKFEDDRLISEAKFNIDPVKCAIAEVIEGHRNMEDLEFYWNGRDIDTIAFTKRAYEINAFTVQDAIRFCRHWKYDPFKK